jgi:hypothetical protein
MRHAALVLLVLALPWGPGPIAAAPEEDAAASPLRLYHVGALTMGRSDFIPRRLGLGRDGDDQRPLFGAEGEEPILPVGTIDELVELVRFQVAPASWESVAGAFLRNIGNHLLVVRQEAEALDGVGSALHALEQRWFRPILLDVVAVRLPAGAATATPADLEALSEGEAVQAAISWVVLPGQRVNAFMGREVAYLHDYDVEVAGKAKMSDPIVHAVNVGFQVDARATVSDAGDHVRVDLNAQAVDLIRLDGIQAGEARTLEAPVTASTRVQATALLAAGAWTLLEGAVPRGEASHTVLLARARVGARASATPGKGFPLPTLENAGMTRLKDRAFSTQHLTAPNFSWLGPALSVHPSRYTPPEPPELPEPMGAIWDDPLLELLREAIAPESWGSRGGSAEVRKGTLYVRAPESAVAAVERLLKALEQALLWSVEVEGRLVELPAAHAAFAAPVLAADAEAALAGSIKDGTATLLEQVRVTAHAGQRNHVAALEERAYVGDYEVEIAEDATIANPVVETQTSGVVLEIQPELTSTRDSVAVRVRFTRSVPAQALRTVRTVLGDIQCPDQRVHELKADVELPLGRAVVAASWAAPGGRRTALLLTARLSGRSAR